MSFQYLQRHGGSAIIQRHLFGCNLKLICFNVWVNVQDDTTPERAKELIERGFHDYSRDGERACAVENKAIANDGSISGCGHCEDDGA